MITCVDRGEKVNVVSPGAYVVSDSVGDVGLSGGQGLFYRDTRHLSKFVLRIDGGLLVPAGRRERGSWMEARTVAGGIRAWRRRTLGGGLEEEVILHNDTGEAVDARVDLEFEADFEDIFEVRGYRRASERGEFRQEVENGSLRFSYQRGDFRRGTVVRVSGEGIEPVAEPGMISVRLDAEETRTLRVSVTLEEGGIEVPRPAKDTLSYAEAPVPETEWMDLVEGWRQSLEDLRMLAFDVGEGLRVPAAGSPWYMALFGRDALITAYQTMLLGVEPAKNTLRALALYQADEYEDFRDAEPGKIPHEIRHGELAYFGEVPHSSYYGSVDATPLFLILLGEVWRWTADTEFARELERPARRAAVWLLDKMDSDERGYVAYETRSGAGLGNHGWKDSDDAILFHSGERAETPISLCEVQGYAYDALSRTAGLAEYAWDDETFAGMLREKATDLKARFDRDFWMGDRGYYALALDGSGRRVDSVTSNAGHLLWSGIVPESRAGAIAGRLLGPELFSGWGIRTMASGEGGYDPDSYHNGSIWPHDNALIAEGLRRYGFREEANRIAVAVIEAAPHFDYRLPEVFAGYPREYLPEPVGSPRACSPQAWAAGAVPLLVRTMVGLDPDLENRIITSAPYLDERSQHLRIDGIPAFQARHKVEVQV